MLLPDSVTTSPFVILTGAGASVPLGLPTTREFLPRCREQVIPGVLNTHPASLPDAERSAFAYHRFQEIADADIEEVLQHLELDRSAAARFAQDFDILRWAQASLRRVIVEKNLESVIDSDTLVRGWADGMQQLADFQRALIDAVYTEVIACYGNVDPERATRLYDGLLGMISKHGVLGGQVQTVPFFTLNYDLAVESSAEGLGIRLIDGFTTNPRERRWSTTPYAQYKENDQFAVVLVKLHGSVKLGRHARGHLIELPEGSYRDPPPHRHAVLYPTLGPKAVGEEPFRSNYQMLRECLLRTKLLMVIGSTLRDSELNELIRTSMDINGQLKLLVVAPEVDCGVMAERIGVSESRVGGVQGTFDIEDPRQLKTGQSRIYNALRHWLGAAVGVSDACRFGTTTTM